MAKKLKYPYEQWKERQLCREASAGEEEEEEEDVEIKVEDDDDEEPLSMVVVDKGRWCALSPLFLKKFQPPFFDVGCMGVSLSLSLSPTTGIPNHIFFSSFFKAACSQ